MSRAKIAVLDFGSQYAHLIAKRFRMLGYYSEILLPSAPLESFKDVKGIVFSGGPSSVYEDNAPEFNSAILDLDVPVLGLCYGHYIVQLGYNGTVGKAQTGEFGFARLNLNPAVSSPLFKGIQGEQQVWKTYDNKVLRYLPHPHIIPWEAEGIAFDVMESRGICYDPMNEGVVIPHYNIDGDLIGIRERTLIKENEIYGKYRPAIINGKMYNHPLGFSLYNLNNSKKAISTFQKAIVFEGEKSCLKYASYFGQESDISVACCGSNLINYQVKLLLSLGVKEIIIAFDRQFQKIGDNEWQKWVIKLKTLYNKYGNYVNISYMFDKNNLLGYKDSPIDCKKDTFLELFKRRVTIE